MTFANAKAVLMIRNPTAGRRRSRLVEDVVRRVRAEGWTVDLVDTQAMGDARRLAETCDARRYAVLAVAGGDGTINEAVNGLLARGMKGPAPTPALAIVPLGTANVLAHELGLGFSAAGIARTVTSGRELLVRPGTATNRGGAARCFSLMAGIGFDAKVVAGVTAPLKRRLGRGAYVWRSLVETRRYHPVRYAVDIDGVRHEAASVIVTRARLYAGPYVVAPDAALDDSLLHVCLFERWGRGHTLRFGLALLTGQLPHACGYRVLTGRDVRISVATDAGERRRQPVQIDGDDALSLPVSVALAPGIVRMLRPV